MSIRIGFGFDVHAFAEDRKLILGGVDIPHKAGLTGHSDADVLCHALTDALLGALALGDIGSHFPDTDPEYKDADSTRLLMHVMDLVHSKGYRLVNTDITVVAERPKLRPYIDQIRQKLSLLLKIGMNDVSVKASTNEKMGFIGREEGVTAYAVVLVQRD